MQCFKNNLCTLLALFFLMGTTAYVVLGNALPAQAEEVKGCVDQDGNGYGNPGRRECPNDPEKINLRAKTSQFWSH